MFTLLTLTETLVHTRGGLAMLAFGQWLVGRQGGSKKSGDFYVEKW